MDSSKMSNLDEKEKIRLAEELITDLENGCPGNLIHILAYTATNASKNVEIHSASGKIREKIGKKPGDPIQIEYHKGSNMGHYSLKGNTDPSIITNTENNCLFEVIGFLTQKDPNEIRADVAKVLRKNIHKIARKIDKIKAFENSGNMTLMVGGARYNGSSPTDAARVLDRSQNRQPNNSTSYGHPRGHASNPGAMGNIDSVENYSRNGMKTGFLSRADQDIVAHHAMSHSITQDAMASLNRGAQSQVVTICAWKINENQLPKVKEFLNGQAVTDAQDFKRVKLVLMHHQGEERNPSADVFVLTLYPMIN
ncbi:uncharacterized protein [Prorops nasuta]|uniref:uncharacterized protein isoform X1 n=1 Tax=Prorops nasuta TaxID=863751 RepID=UPI0034CE4BDC